ncbi:MAG: polysaccharide deacetylase family protein [Defluviitaleaceae bacterium]|nr:polysaccharide deacetylase family protein [Defluviitaleaceae bacterium]MCL2262221.1 polysaccharide deacetylase family protein [Defluviitaleaceae bacterium]
MKPKIALTFDDGPGEFTPRILDTLEKNNARASFFVVGRKIADGADTIKRAHEMGNEIISHSWSHCKNPNLSGLSADEIRKELTDTHNLIRETLGISPPMFRPPYGALSDTLENVARELGFAIILWTIDSWDWKSKSPPAIHNEIFTNLHDNAIILCHDVHATTAEAMERVIPELLQKYELVTVSEVLED